MFEGIYRIADLDIRISSVHERVHELCSAYCTQSAHADIEAVTTQDDIDLERIRSGRGAEEDRGAGYSDGYLETLAVYRKIAERSPYHDTVLFHGSAVAVDGKGYIFTARSGTGKSTHARLWRELLGDRAVMINDDKPLIRIRNGEAEVFGTPWDGKHRLSSNSSVQVKAVGLLNRGEENMIRPADVSEVYPALIQQIYRPMDTGAMEKTLELIDRLTEAVSFWRMECNMEIGAAEMAYGAMRGDKE